MHAAHLDWRGTNPEEWRRRKKLGPVAYHRPVLHAVREGKPVVKFSNGQLYELTPHQKRIGTDTDGQPVFKKSYTFHKTTLIEPSGKLILPGDRHV